MPFTFPCPECNTPGTITEELRGRRIKCSKCSSSFQAPLWDQSEYLAIEQPKGRAAVEGRKFALYLVAAALVVGGAIGVMQLLSMNEGSKAAKTPKKIANAAKK